MTADQFYVDPSALRALYVHEARSRAVVTWRARLKGSLVLTRFGHAELVNAVTLGCFRGDYSESEMKTCLEHIEQDLADGDLRLADLLWRSALDRAQTLSRRYSPQLGTRALDVLHVASALELELPRFVTYDERQAKLAEACGLKVVRP